MKILIAPDKFKDALAAQAAAETIAAALAETRCEAEMDFCPLTDGGEGFVEILTRAAQGRRETFRIRNARGSPIAASVGFVPWSHVPNAARALLALPELGARDEIALVEMASASGLEQLPAAQRNPWHATSFGTGELLVHARARGARAVLVGIGGSATHDVGLGALRAMGGRFLGGLGNDLDWPSPSAWPEITRIVPPDGKGPPIRIACDVSNPLLGPRGAAHVYSIQKGLPPADLPALENATEAVARLLCRTARTSLASMAEPGMGAAGGIAFGLRTLLGAQIVEGAELVARWLSLPARVAAADVIITGEGRYDASSLEGKGPGAIVRLAEQQDKPIHFFAGAAQLAAAGRLRLHVITPPGQPLPVALSRCRSNLRDAVLAAFRAT